MSDNLAKKQCATCHSDMGWRIAQMKPGGGRVQSQYRALCPKCDKVPCFITDCPSVATRAVEHSVMVRPEAGKKMIGLRNDTFLCERHYPAVVQYKRIGCLGWAMGVIALVTTIVGGIRAGPRPEDFKFQGPFGKAALALWVIVAAIVLGATIFRRVNHLKKKREYSQAILGANASLPGLNITVDDKGLG